MLVKEFSYDLESVCFSLGDGGFPSSSPYGLLLQDTFREIGLVS